MPRVYVSIGSNIDREASIRAGVFALRERFGPLILSSVYESEAVGFEGDNFFNLVAGFDTAEPVEAVAAGLREIEDRNGRDRSGPRFSSRTLDLDMLLYDDRVCADPQIPRFEILENAFVLWPLAEIAPETLHPQEGVRFIDLWVRFDKEKQQLWPVEFDWGFDE
ncbi:2-amino-4-hydroxy-6-hydroxymethyldihydropteridine diphosphokinase [Thiohalomonas denitrificans]|uniref:2-amino-4-hydroxy-6-hydroxymethyldihydropteridine diphosphokinase n=1 Tax=Thiohalomonas denitrificans TaxID=415747 RepID=A0A1G5PU67_9GAMM|nr:2-amino-4-hydroxy-6-hydroxymethyldihydropteridine diphosphokinase [Thiohalomonas denitrificans]SCZ52589.1 2-amino-4-hydroxy-6-hydroxymethyldihydropteridinediphosphokinase [Thiohalomonas denitrificans]